VNPIKVVFGKLIKFINESEESDPLKKDGLPIVAHQTLLYEQQVTSHLLI
jgi:hypothetical protein